MIISVLLHNIRSLHNVGSIFRTADGAGVKKLYLCGETGYPPRPDISKTALGAQDSVPWEYWIDPLECARHLKKKGIRLVALEQTKKSIDYRQFKSKGPICLVLGHEVNGVSDAMLKLCDAAIEIPMKGKKQSLNVAVAFGVAVYSF